MPLPPSKLVPFHGVTGPPRTEHTGTIQPTPQMGSGFVDIMKFLSADAQLPFQIKQRIQIIEIAPNVIRNSAAIRQIIRTYSHWWPNPSEL